MSTTQNEKAVRVYGAGRLFWQWNGAVYTASGIKVPPEVMESDDELIDEGEDIPDDADALDDLKPTLPLEALPEGYSLAPPPKKN